MIGWAVLLVVVGLLAYIRLAPTDPARWHQPIEAEADADPEGGAIRVVDAGEDALARLHEIALDTPRTRVLAGSVEEGRVTYVTRSLVFGFPDYTTAEVADGQLRIFGRLRFGRSDMGVNRARIEDWLVQL